MSENTPNTPEPLTPEQMAQVEERFIKTQVATFSQTVADLKIEEARAYCAPLIIAGVDDKEGYKKVDDARKAVKKYRTSVETKRKELNDFPKRFTNAVNAEAKRLTALLEPIEQEQERKLAVIDAEKAKFEAEKKRLRDELQTKREYDLKSMGFLLQSDVFFVLDNVVIPRGSIGDMTPEAWSVEFQKAKQASDAKKEREDELAKLRAIADEAAAKAAAEAKALQDATPPIGHNSGEPEPFFPSEQKTPLPPPTAKPTPPSNDPFAAFGPPATTPAHFDPARQPNVTVTVHDFDKGFEACKAAVLAIMNDPTPRKRADFIQAFQDLKPNA